MALRLIRAAFLLGFTALCSVSSVAYGAPFGNVPETVEQELTEQLPEYLTRLEQLEEIIERLPYKQQVNITAKALKLLAAQMPKPGQKEWVNKQLSSSLMLTSENPDHPEQQITLINIAGLAKATSMHWQVQQVSLEQQADIVGQQWDWASFDQGNLIIQRALVHTIEAISPQLLTQLQYSLINQAFLSKATNRTLATLLTGQPNLALAQQLFSNPADEFSYQQLSQIDSAFPELQAIKLLTTAVKNNALQSMSLLTLSTKYAHNKNVRDTLILHLKNKESAWLAASAISQTKNIDLQREVITLSKGSKSKAVVFVHHALQETER